MTSFLEVHFQDSYLVVFAPQRFLAALQIIPPVLQLLFLDGLKHCLVQQHCKAK